MDTKKPVLARPFLLRCPRCKNRMDNFTEIIFTSEFTIVFNGVCCGAEITSGELNILELLPGNPDPSQCH